jgi:hypothetical protein
VNRYQHMALHSSLALLFAAGSLMAFTWSRGHSAAANTITPHAVSYYYGTNGTKMAAAVQNIWPQQVGPYCAVATAMGVVNYIDEEDHVKLRFTSRNDQKTIATADQKSGASQWGYAKPINVSAGITNIAPDRGIDPRSAAYIQERYAPTGTIFHNYIYRWQFHYPQAPKYRWQAWQATTSLFRAWLSYAEPMSVIINGGEHSVLVSGGWTTAPADKYYPVNVTGVIIRDPEFAGTVSRFEVDNDAWTNHGTDFGAGYYTLWSRFYGQNANHSVNHDDPEPTVGIYAPRAKTPDHWYQGFSWIRRDANSANGLSNPDWAFTDLGKELTAP